MGFARRKPVRVIGRNTHILSGAMEFHVSPYIGATSSRHHFRWVLPVVVVLAAISFFVTRGCLNKVKNVMPESAPAETLEQAPEATASAVHVDEWAVRMARRWLAESDARPTVDRTLLERLVEAERQGNGILAADTIEKLRNRPSMADLDDALARRLGVLNLARFLSPSDTRWSKGVVVRRTDSLARLAREHAATVAAIVRINGLVSGKPLVPGSTLRIPHFPRVVFVVHLGTRTADLLLNDRFFKRYYVSVSPATAPGNYPVVRDDESTYFRNRLKALGVRMTPDDLAELDLFLAPGSSLVVSDM